MIQPLPIAHRNAFDDAVRAATGDDLRAAAIDTIQVNVGLRCNLACHHCHVVSGPSRSEEMTRATMLHVLRAAHHAHARTIDITGGAPEMHPLFGWFVATACAAGHRVIIRTNLTILLEEGYESLPDFFAALSVHLIASLPCYLPQNVDKQRGRNVYDDSIEAIRRLNAVGYGVEPALPLDLIYNPLGPHLPPPQGKLEDDYRRELSARHGVVFTSLYTITNMAIGRFLHDLRRDGRAAEYEQLLRESFNPATVDPLMCRHQVHVSHDGTLHDCDFNYALGMPCGGAAPRRVQDFDEAAMRNRRVVTGEHCFGCTAGFGSSCGGALV